MGRLPPDSEQQFLIDELGRLISQCGQVSFVEAPIRLPTSADFPDRWTADVPGLRVLLKRLFRYVGLDGYRPELNLFDGERSVDGVNVDGTARYRHEGAAAWFAGVQEKSVYFGCSREQLQGPADVLVGTMAHEVAHAWRTVNRLVEPELELEERLTDLTTVFLGFGVFTVNNTHRYRTEAVEDGALVGSRWTMQRVGYLSAEAMSFAFAAQIVARRLSCWDTFRLLRWLEPNQRGHTRAALRVLRPAESLWKRLRPDGAVDLASLGVPGANRER